MLICGIDPGVTGAVAFVVTGKRPMLKGVVSMPVLWPGAAKKARREYDWISLAGLLKAQRPDFVVLEQQWSRPREGVSSAFKAGLGYGGLLGLMAGLGLPHEVIQATTWKHPLQLRKQDKEASRQLAIRMMPEGSALFARKLDHGRAEAALMAYWKALSDAPDPALVAYGDFAAG